MLPEGMLEQPSRFTRAHRLRQSRRRITMYSTAASSRCNSAAVQINPSVAAPRQAPPPVKQHRTAARRAFSLSFSITQRNVVDRRSPGADRRLGGACADCQHMVRPLAIVAVRGWTRPHPTAFTIRQGDADLRRSTHAGTKLHARWYSARGDGAQVLGLGAVGCPRPDYLAELLLDLIVQPEGIKLGVT
jgi:hypothetical protein